MTYADYAREHGEPMEGREVPVCCVMKWFPPEHQPVFCFDPNSVWRCEDCWKREIGEPIGADYPRKLGNGAYNFTDSDLIELNAHLKKQPNRLDIIADVIGIPAQLENRRRYARQKITQCWRNRRQNEGLPTAEE